MTWELRIILGEYYVEAIFWLLNLNQLKNLHIVFCHFLRENERTDVYHIDVRVFHRKYSGYLWVLFLLELFYRKSSNLTYRVRVDMNFKPALLFDLRPAPLEFILHVTPDINRLTWQLIYFVFSGLFKKIKSILALYNGGFAHQKFELVVSSVCFMSPPRRLQLDRGQNWSVRPGELLFRVHNSIINCIDIAHAHEKLILRVVFQFLFDKLNHFVRVQNAHLNWILCQ